jgi:uncharacterized membrane protein YphA (DoxX/SURF4 family)
MRSKIPMMLVRMIVGLIFVGEGILKFVLPGELGTGRFAHLGFPFPQILAPFVGAVEIASGAALILSLYAGDAAVLLLFVIGTALMTTKFPILLGRQWGPFPVPKNLAHTGYLSFFHEARLDLAMLVSLIAIAIDSGVQLGRRRRGYRR